MQPIATAIVKDYQLTFRDYKYLPAATKISINLLAQLQCACVNYCLHALTEGGNVQQLYA